MLKLSKIFLTSILISIFVLSMLAAVKGRGEAKGEVISSWMSGEKVVFRLDINTQNSWTGPRLSNPNNFVYSGEDKMKITEGDRLTITYNSSDEEVIAEKVEFVNDRAGEIDQTSYLMPGIIILAILAVIFIGIYFFRRKQRELHTT